jgi:hypothetical protein
MTEEKQQETPAPQRSIWVVVAVSALTSIIVWGAAELIQGQMAPEPPPPSTTERILDGIEEAWGAASDMDKDDLETIAGLADLLGGGSGDVRGDMEHAMKIVDMALGALGDNGDLGDLAQGLGVLGEFGDLNKLMDGALKQLGGLDPGELDIGGLDLSGLDLSGLDLGEFNLGDLGDILGGGDTPSAPKAQFELSPDADDFGGLEALDEHLQDQ